ncbi:MAG TPA: GNAT family N-acetyltransferase, partial [Polyangiaceae bacterium]
DALETAGCVTPEHGWMPMHLSLWHDGRLAALAPAYVKGNSEGEFVFDHSWARFAHARLALPYFPKLILAVPFTPATGPRLLVSPNVDCEWASTALARGVTKLIEQVGCSSAHVLFPTEQQARELGAAGFALRHGVQFHWHNAGYFSFEDFVGRFNSKKRNQIRRERRELDRQGIEIQVATGRDITEEIVEAMYGFYCDTVSKHYWGRQYLNHLFFHTVCSEMAHQIHIVVARDRRSRKPIAGAFNLLGPRALYGRYWGACEERPFLHFNVCFYAAIEDCIARGLELFEPGAGGEHKVARGFEPTLTHSAHYLRDPRLDAAVRDFLHEESRALTDHVSEWHERPVLRSRGENGGG